MTRLFRRSRKVELKQTELVKKSPMRSCYVVLDRGMEDPSLGRIPIRSLLAGEWDEGPRRVNVGITVRSSESRRALLTGVADMMRKKNDPNLNQVQGSGLGERGQEDRSVEKQETRLTNWIFCSLVVESRLSDYERWAGQDGDSARFSDLFSKIADVTVGLSELLIREVNLRTALEGVDQNAALDDVRTPAMSNLADSLCNLLLSLDAVVLELFSRQDEIISIRRERLTYSGTHADALAEMKTTDVMRSLNSLDGSRDQILDDLAPKTEFGERQ